MVPTCSDDAQAVGGKSCARNRARVPLEGRQKAPVSAVPYLRRMVIAGGDNALAVTRNLGVLDRIIMGESEQQTTIVRVPPPRRMIVTGAEYPLAIGGEHRHINGTFMLEGPQRFHRCLGHGEVCLLRLRHAPTTYRQIECLTMIL